MEDPSDNLERRQRLQWWRWLRWLRFLGEGKATCCGGNQARACSEAGRAGGAGEALLSPTALSRRMGRETKSRDGVLESSR